MVRQLGVMSTLIEHWRGQLLEVLFPTFCVNCRRQGAALCDQCRSTIQYVAPPLCQRCGDPLRHAGQNCVHCRAHPLTISHIRSVVFFEGAAREAIHGLKYNRRKDVVPALADILVRYLTQSRLEFDVITAVPLHPEREQQRGYNQAELLARALSAKSSHRFVGGMRRVRATQDQIGLDAAGRHKNVSGAFAADPKAFRGRRVLVIDDVCTTGATLDACAVALVEQGAQAVYGLTVARPR